MRTKKRVLLKLFKQRKKRKKKNLRSLAFASPYKGPNIINKEHVI